MQGSTPRGSSLLAEGQALAWPAHHQLPALHSSKTQTAGLLPLHAASVSSQQEFLPLLELASKGEGKEGLSCSRAAVINIASKLGSIGLCPHVPEAPMYPYRASKVSCQGRCWRCCPRHGAHGGEGAPGSPPAPATHPLPGSPRWKHRDWDSSSQD